ncbi:MAG: precorrin-2 dehydrogenase/sirohydrochlorin ferrochelatase family protein [Thermoproteus sp.]
MRIPLWIEASRLKVVVFGGGSVGTRRARLFASAGARVRVVAKEVSPDIRALGVEVKLVDLREYEPDEDIKWADIVVVAVNDAALAERLFALAESMGKLVNDATDAARTHVVVPYFRDVEGIKVATTSEGVAGTPARLSLDLIDECIRRSWIPTFFRAYAAAKEEAKRRISDVRRRLAFYRELADDGEFMDYVKRGDLDSALRRAHEILKRYV